MDQGCIKPSKYTPTYIPYGLHPIRDTYQSVLIHKSYVPKVTSMHPTLHPMFQKSQSEIYSDSDLKKNQK